MKSNFFAFLLVTSFLFIIVVTFPVYDSQEILKSPSNNKESSLRKNFYHSHPYFLSNQNNISIDYLFHIKEDLPVDLKESLSNESCYVSIRARKFKDPTLQRFSPPCDLIQQDSKLLQRLSNLLLTFILISLLCGTCLLKQKMFAVKNEGGKLLTSMTLAFGLFTIISLGVSVEAQQTFTWNCGDSLQSWSNISCWNPNTRIPGIDPDFPDDIVILSGNDYIDNNIHPVDVELNEITMNGSSRILYAVSASFSVQNMNLYGKSYIYGGVLYISQSIMIAEEAYVDPFTLNCDGTVTFSSISLQ